ncbi:hypothetical protein A1O3_02878 [Capronia epimyces CBS 606.96]|uniref:BTB domain-containing protein n=1 Tax=Capronia epimyces CBS 606.96 TaxID=1182542 RepID=W9YKP0_9EURO|nr:uncharacterized protein A1O3_02878 [Capronia epimyces CBS 606.96]EXJ89811.1 hypothetical protein A1O3_02878 [Capronia epimyces CBS 606.96]
MADNGDGDDNEGGAAEASGPVEPSGPLELFSPLPADALHMSNESRRFNSAIVTLLVGPSRLELKAHKDALLTCKYFAICLQQDGFREGVTNEIHLPDEQPDNMAKILQWVYSPEPVRSYNRVFQENWRQCRGLQEKEDLLEGLIADFILAHKYLLDEMTDAVVDVVRRQQYPDTEWVKWKHLGRLKSSGHQCSSLWEGLMLQLAELIIKEECDLNDLLDDGLEEDTDALRNLMRYMAGFMFGG